MSTVITEPAADVVLLGVGVVSGTIAAELTAAGYKVAGMVRGPYWNYATDFASTKYDEWGIQWERKFDVPYAWGAQTIRNSSTQFALPARRATFPIQYHSFGLGVGGAAHHYGGAMGRNGPWGFSMASSTASRYGAGYLASINPFDDTQDWPMDYAHYEPYYTAWEQNFGLSGSGAGSTGNGGAIGSNAGGTPIAMSKNYPLPGHPDTPLGKLFHDSTEALGYNPFPSTSSLASQAYVNPYGVQINGCVYEGWCTGGGCNFVCETGAKGNSAFRSVPAAVKSGKFTLCPEQRSLQNGHGRQDRPRNGCPLLRRVRKHTCAARYGLLQRSPRWQPGKGDADLGCGRAVQFDYGHGDGREGLHQRLPPVRWHRRPKRHDSRAGPQLHRRKRGRRLHPVRVHGRRLRPHRTGLHRRSEQSAGGYAGSGPTNVSTAGGASSGSQGSKYKATLQNRYINGGKAAGVGFGGMAPDLPNTNNMWDLDPHYSDLWGDPLPRITHEWTPNPYQAATFFASNAGNVGFLAILNKMGAQNISKGGATVVAPYSAHNDWWGHHIRGGNRVGKDAASSTFNKWQQCWAAPNLFAAGECNNTTGDTVPSGTHQAGMQSEVASEGIQMYLKSPGLLS